jgi:hypothetical protein
MQINLFHFERDTLLRAGLHDTGSPVPPFLVIASNEINEELTNGGWKNTAAVKGRLRV